MTLATRDISAQVRMGAAGAVGAVSLLWAGNHNPALFQAGTVLAVLCLLPLARGFGARGGAILGLLLGVVWIAARLGLARHADLADILTEVNVIVIAAMVTMGGLAGALLGCSNDSTEIRAGSGAESRPANTSAALKPSGGLAMADWSATDMNWSEALACHRQWMAEWNCTGSPWTSFDNHIREVVRALAGLKRLRCYRVAPDGQLHPLSRDGEGPVLEVPCKDLLTHVITTGKRFVAGTPQAGPLIQQLLESGSAPLSWAVPIRDGNTSIGLITAEAFGPCSDEAQLQAVADFAEELWLHVHHADMLRTARQTDQGSGLTNRTDFLAAFKQTLEECHHLNEPVVVMVVCLEGLRGLDDANQWSKRDELIEAVGQTIAAGIRKDDVVGRFSDSQFVALMRRLDVPLAELICRKLLASIAKVICDFEVGAWITPRAGLSGSGFAKTDGEHLLAQAISALQYARKQDVLLVSESPAAMKEQAKP